MRTSKISTPLVALAMLSAVAQANESPIQFDLPPTIAVETAVGDDHTTTARCELRVSSLIASPHAPAVDQWLIECQPRDANVRIVDYAPKTSAQSDIEGPIQIKISDEKTGSLGLSLDGNYGHSVRGHLGADRGNKNTSSRQYNMAAQSEAVVAAGTINRGRGVYFKLRRSAKQILEGEKVFQITMQVPDHWRGTLMDVTVIAQSQQKSLAPWDRKTKTLGSSHFVVATYRRGDAEAAEVSGRLADAEQWLRQITLSQSERNDASLSSILRSVAVKLDLEEPKYDFQAIQRILAGTGDPYLDKEIQRLPMKVRVAILEYCELRDDFAQLTNTLPNQADRLATGR